MMTAKQLRTRERAIMQMLADGKARKTIAYDMCRSQETISRTIIDLKARVGVATEAGLVAKALREGWIK